METRHRRAADSARRSLPNLREKLQEAQYRGRHLDGIVAAAGPTPGPATWRIDNKEVTTDDVGRLLTRWTANRGAPHRCPEIITLDFEHAEQTIHVDNRGHSFHLALPDDTYVGDSIQPDSQHDRLNAQLNKQRHAIQLAGSRIDTSQEKIDTYTAQVAQQEERKDEPFRHSTRLTSARTELAEVSRRLLTRYADPGTVERLDTVLGSRPPGTAQLDQAWENMRTEAVATPDLLRRWEILTEVTGHTADGIERPIDTICTALAGFDPLVEQLNRHALRRGSVTDCSSAGIGPVAR